MLSDLHPGFRLHLKASQMKPRNELKTRRAFTPTELQSHSKTVRHELVTLVGIEERFSRPGFPDDVIAKNALIESFAMHSRALVVFLFGHLDQITVNYVTERFSALRVNDILAWDFHRGWEADCPQPVELIVRSKYQADKHVAHIITERREVNQLGSATESRWNFSDVTGEICRIFEHFLKTAPHANFDAAELKRMTDLLAKRTTSSHLRVGVPPSNNPPSLAKPTFATQSVCGTTSSRTTPLESGW